MKIPKIVIATNNRHKLYEIIDILRLANWDFAQILPLSAFPAVPQVEENGLTYEENAKAKAVAAAKSCGIPALAEDSGLEVKSLGNRPGAASHRFVNEAAQKNGPSGEADAISAANKEIIGTLDENGLEFEGRDAKYVSAACIALPDGTAICGHGECLGRIADSERGSAGFGFDPIFCPKEYEYERTFGELGQEIKNTISHRKRAIDALKKAVDLAEIPKK